LIGIDRAPLVEIGSRPRYHNEAEKPIGPEEQRRS
jgi:hypothetical protein